MSAAPQPALLWSFNGSNVESLTQLSPSSTTGTPVYTNGKYGQAITLTNTQGSSPTTFITYTTIPVFSNSSGFTISFWINSSASITSTSNCLGISSPTLRDNIYFQLTSTTAGFSGNAITGTTATTFTVPPSTWVNYSLTANASTWNQYINGILGTTSTYTATSLTGLSGPLTVGTTPLSTNSTTFSIQDLRVYSSNLSAAHIYGIYQSQGIPPTLTATSNVAQPSLLWSFENSLREIITGALPNSTIGTSISYTNGKYGQGFNMIPTTSNGFIYYTSDNIPWIPLFPYAQGLTTSIWINYTVPGTSGWIMDLSTYNGGAVFRDRIRITISSTPAINLNIGATTGGFSYNVPGSGQTGVWYHYAFVINISSGLIISYLNGVQTNSTAVPSSWSSDIQYYGGNIGVGCRVNGSDPATTATIDDLRIYNTALTDAQIYGIYQSQGIPPTLTIVPTSGNLPSPTYAWPFNGSTIDVIQGKDYATSNVSGTLGVRPYPFYDTTGQKAGNSSIFFNNPTSQLASNALIYNNISFPIDQSNACTYSFWFKWITFGGALFKVYTSTGGGMGTIQTSGNNLNMTFGSIAGSSILPFTTTFNISSLSVWYHVAVVATSLGQTVYGNGNLSGTSLYTTPLNIQSFANIIGAFNLSCVNGLGGNPTLATSNEIADLRFYNTALSASQIQTIYQSGGASPVVIIN